MNKDTFPESWCYPIGSVDITSKFTINSEFKDVSVKAVLSGKVVTISFDLGGNDSLTKNLFTIKDEEYYPSITSYANCIIHENGAGVVTVDKSTGKATCSKDVWWCGGTISYIID